MRAGPAVVRSLASVAGWRRPLRYAYRAYTAFVLGTAAFHAARAASYLAQHWKGLNVAMSFMIAYAVFHLQTLFIAVHCVITLNLRVKGNVAESGERMANDETEDLVSATPGNPSVCLVDYFIDWEIKQRPSFSRRPYVTFWIQFVMAFVNFTLCLLIFILQGFSVLHQQFPSDYYFDGVVQDYLLPVFMCHSFLFYCISITIYVTVFALLSDWARLINKQLRKNFQEPGDFRHLLSEATTQHHRLSEINKHANLMYRFYVTFLLGTDLPIFIVLFYVTALSPSRNGVERWQARRYGAGSPRPDVSSSSLPPPSTPPPRRP